jgi:predicted CXXCH cytochrome family protein
VKTAGLISIFVVVGVYAADDYVDSKLCADCHSRQAQTYRLTGMGRSFYRPQPQNLVEDYAGGNSYYHEASDSHFTMIQRDGKYYQRRYQIGYQGKETNVEEKRIDFVMGSGNHARTYLHRTGRNTLQQLPLGWYSEGGGRWGMSPGYDHPNHQFSGRQITYECMFCHNGYPKIPAANQEDGADPVFDGALPEGIDCQRCHGPGGRHIALASSPGARQPDIRAAIVNPARLSPERAMDVCAQCHLQTNTTVLSHSILRYGRGPFSYGPGEALSAFRISFDRPADSAARFEIVSSVYRLRQSACFLKSGGSMRCTTCHDPHNAPGGEAAIQRYNTVCRQCHSSRFDRLIAAGAHTTSADCVSCHMPKRRTDDVVHVVMTDHYIQRKKPERDLLAALSERPAEKANREEIIAYDRKPGRSPQDQLYFAVAQVRDPGARKSGIPRLTRLIKQYHPDRAEYYLDLADAFEAEGEPARALPFYEEAARRRPGSTVILRKLGTVLMETNQLDRAAAVLQRTLKANPADPFLWRLTGQVYLRQGKIPDAIAALGNALATDPDLPDVRNNVGSILAASGDLAGAEREFRESMRMQPNLAEARANLARVLGMNHDFPQSTYYFESAIRLKPDYASARLEYARMLNSRGDKAGALREFREAVRINPASGSAQLELAAALAATGDLNDAVRRLRLAAQSVDPDVRRTALELLKKFEAGN